MINFIKNIKNRYLAILARMVLNLARGCGLNAKNDMFKRFSCLKGVFYAMPFKNSILRLIFIVSFMRDFSYNPFIYVGNMLVIYPLYKITRFKHDTRYYYLLILS